LSTDSKNQIKKTSRRKADLRNECAMCRRAIRSKAEPLTVELSRKNEKRVILTFDKKECVLLFERLRRIYGDDFFFEVAR
jgi:hypothetical protein